MSGDAALREALENLREDWSLEEIVKEAIRNAEWCCEVGCGSGACETCPCCCAGYCVSGRDGLPNNDPEAVGQWLEIASAHNPAIAALRPLLMPVDEREAGIAAAKAILYNLPVDGFGQDQRLREYAAIWGNAAAKAVLALLNGGAK